MINDNRGEELPRAEQDRHGRARWAGLAGWRSAVVLHSDRFERPRVLSAVALVSAQRVVMVDGGVATITEVGRTGVWLAAAVATYGAVLATVTEAPSVGVAVIAGSVGVVVVFGCALRLLTQLAARRTSPVGDRPLLVANVAGARGRHRGDVVVGEVTRFGDQRGSRLILTVKADNGAALALYRRHGFVETGTRRGRIAMERLAHPAEAAVPGSTARAGTGCCRVSDPRSTVAARMPVWGKERT